jgi:hypothetical protein
MEPTDQGFLIRKHFLTKIESSESDRHVKKCRLGLAGTQVNKVLAACLLLWGPSGKSNRLSQDWESTTFDHRKTM